MKTCSRHCASVLLGSSLFLPVEPPSHANIIVDSTLSFGSVQVVSTAGNVNLATWQSSAYAQAGANAQSSSAFAASSSAGSADTPVPGGVVIGSGMAASSPFTAPSSSASGYGSIPGAIAGFDTSAGRASADTAFSITGGSGSVNVTFSTVINAHLTLSSDAYGVYGMGENDFALSVNGSPVLFSDHILTVGPNQSANGTISSELLTDTLTLQYGTTYYLWLEADAETTVVNSTVAAVPEPAAGSVITGFLGLSALAISLLRQRSASKSAKRRLGMLLGGVLAGSILPADAMYLGSDAPDVCQTCGVQATRQSAGGLSTSLTEGNLREDYQVVTVKSGYGTTLPFSLTYNSYNADGSKSQLDTGLGFGWTHTYNTLLFQQRGQLFRLGADGRVTQYYQNYSGSGVTYTSDHGYFETVTQQPDGSYIVTNKNQSWWHFGAVPNTPFLVAGPVYRLTQMGDRNQNITKLSYNGSGELASVTDPFGRTLSFAYNPQGKLINVTDPAERITTFTYDPLGRMPVTITDPIGNTVNYTYNSQYQMTKKVDRDGRVYMYMYKSLRPFMVTDGTGQPWFSLTNPTNWAVNETNLTFSLRRQYVPSTTTSTDGRSNLWQYAYDSNGYLTQVTAPDGTATQYTYDPATRMLSTITDPVGHVTRYQYDANGNRTSSTDALGNLTTYTYEPVFNQMTSTTDPNGRVTTYQYDGHGNRIQETDPLLHTQRWTYDANGNVLSSTDKDLHITTYQYNTAGELTRSTDPEGNVTTYTYDAIGDRLSSTDPLGHVTWYQYDALDHLIGVTNALGGATSYAYDPLGRQLSRTDPDTNTTAYGYDVRGRLTQTTNALGGVTSYGYDPNDNRIASTNQLGHTTTYAYDALNRLTGSTNAAGGVSRYTYDHDSNRISSTDPNTNTTAYAYDALNRRIATTNALGGVTTYDYSTPSGPPCCSPTAGSSLITRIEDPDGNVTFYHYDELNRRVQVVRKNSDTNDVINPADAVTTTAYDPVGNVLELTDPVGLATVYSYDADNRQTNLINAAGDTTSTIYDAVGNVIRTTAPNGNTTTNYYDALNRVITVYDEIGPITTTTYDGDGNHLTTTDPLGHVTTYQYDGLNRQVEVIDPLGRTTTTSYDADNNILSTTNRNGFATTYGYDALDRAISVTDALGGTTTTVYDPDGNVISQMDANAHMTRYHYDALNRQVSTTYPDAAPNARTSVYDPAGNLISRQDQAGQITTYSYDPLYFMTNRAYLPSGTNDSFTYDLDGRMLTATRGGWVDTFAYDGASRLTNTVQNGRSLSYTYNLPGRVQTNAQPSGRTLNYTYDARNRLVTLSDVSAHSLIVTYVYDAADRVVLRSNLNGTTASYSYNANNWVTSLQHSNSLGRLAGFAYTYDHEGNKIYEQKLDNVSDSEAYAYDAIDRLTNYDVGSLSGSVIPSPALAKSWSLDPLGNWNNVISNSVPQVRTYGPANELLTINALSFAYDADGNLSNDTVSVYRYDEENRLIQVQRLAGPAIVGQYYYDALGRRVGQVADPAGLASTNLYFYDGSRLIEEQDPATNTIATYTYGNYLDEVLTMDRAGHTYYYHPNALWSAEVLSDSAGSAAERYSYDAYGSVTVLDGSYHPLGLNAWGTPHSAVTNRFLFTGRELDEETALYDYRARHFDSATGRFLQRDPAGYVDGMNLYEYVRGRPTAATDPDGLKQKLEVDSSVDPVAGKCGKLDFHVPWSLSEASPKGGQIVQAITFTWEVKDCDGVVQLSPPPWLSPLSYYEAWIVSKGATAATPVNDDWVWFGKKPFGGKCTTGRVEIKAQARFYEGLVRLPGYFIKPNPRTLAGRILYSAEQSAVPATDRTRFNDPKAAGTAALERELVFKWNCCPDQERDTQIVSKKP